VNQLTPKDRDIAMVFQTYALYPHMTVRQNMAFPLKIARMPQDEINRRVEEAADLLELREHLDRKPANLSGGQRQRVAMGRAIVRNPQAFLMDEPLSNLDAKLRGQMRTSIARLQQRLKVTTVYVTHDQTEAMTLGDRILVLRLGEMQQVGTPQELYGYPANLFVAGFIGSPSMNFMPGELADGMLKWPLGDVSLPAERLRRLEQDKAPRDVIVGIRPEEFEDAALLESTKREQGTTTTVKPEVLESLGSDVFAYFPVPKPDSAHMAELERVAEEVGAGDIPGSSGTFVGRLDPATRAQEGVAFNLWFDTHKLHLFDASTGRVLGR
jgi:multiple sugar transport system ATP-binding protein